MKPFPTKGLLALAVGWVGGFTAIHPSARTLAHRSFAAGAEFPTQERERSLPAPVEEGASASARQRLYVIGGYNALGRDSNTVYVFDGRNWSYGPRLPVAVDHPAATVRGGRLYVAGGFGAFGASDRVFVLSSSGRSWQSAGRLSQSRGAFALVSVRGWIYAIGGKDASGNEIGSVEALGPKGTVWHSVTQLPAARDHLAGFVYRSSACVAGGRSPTTARVDCYDPDRHAWWRLPHLPMATSGAGAATFRGTPVVGGGELAGEGGGIITQLATFSSGRWQRYRMLVPRHGLQFSLFQGRIWACGGGSRPGLHPVATCTSIF